MPIPTRQSVLAATAGLLLSCNCAFAQHTAPADRNAALAYSTLFYSDLPKDLTDAVDAADLNEVGLDNAANQPEKFKAAAAAVAGHQGAVLSFIAASKLDKCDFEIAYERGFNALLPHLGSMRKAGRMLRVDARRLLLEGNAEAAAERVAAIYRLSKHLKSDDVLISSLVGIAIAGLANSESEALVKSNKLTAIGRENILQAIAGLGRNDPFGVKEAAMGERTITIKWIRERFPAPGSGAEFIEEISQEWGMNVEARPELVEIGKMDDAAFARSLDKLEEYHNLMQTQWDLPDAPDRLEVLAAMIQEGGFGPLTRFLAPSFSKARAGQTKAEAELAAVTKRLKDFRPSAAIPAGDK